MKPTPAIAAGFLLTLALNPIFIPIPDDPATPDKPPAARPVPSSKSVPKRRVPARSTKKKGDEPPSCESEVRRPQTAPIRSMPDLFNRMSDQMMRNPATAWQGMVQDLSRMDGPALEGVSLTIAEERRSGQKARAEYLKKAEEGGYRTIDDPRRLAYLRALVEHFAGRMTHRDRYPNIEVTLIDAPVPDGQSFPGGYLVFTSGLLEEPDEATVAGVVAHELAHLDRGHLYDYARRGKLAEATYSRRPGMDASFDQLFTRQMALFGLMMNPYRPEHESEADCTSVTWLYQEGYDPKALVGFFERLHDRNRDQPANPFFNFGQTHPFSLDRADEVVRRLRQLQQWKPRNDLGLFPDNLARREARPPTVPVRENAKAAAKKGN